jgi:type VI secretion system protein ImpA
MTGDLIDLSALLAPLDHGEHGAGEDLRADYAPTSSYQRLRDARAAARAAERARDAQGDIDSPPAEGWREVATVAQQALATQSKDFEIAAWLTEALVRLHGLRGLEAGAKLITGLCERHWESGFPLPDSEGLDGRASPIGGLSGSDADGTVMQPLRRLALFRRIDGTGVGLYQWDQSEETAGLSEERRQARHESGTPELQVLESEARVDSAYLSDVGRQAAAALEAWREMDQSLDARFGVEAPSVRKVGGLLERIGEVIVRLGGATVSVEADGAHAGAAAPSGGGAESARVAPATLASREDALRQLDRIAEYFRRTEPHSPLAYTLEEAVRRGRMSLADLLLEVLPDEDARKGMLGRLGIRTSTG